MKRFTILIITLTLTILRMTAQDTSTKGTITLSHQGNETTFAYNEMTKVMEAAADGDTVQLSSGYFQGDFVMNKKLAFIGAGADRNNSGSNYTCYEGKIVIKLPEQTKLTARLFDGIYFSNSNTRITFSTAIDNVIFRKCYWNNEIITANDSIGNMLVDRCYADLYGVDKCKKLVARNSNLCGTPSSTRNSTHLFFYHCNLYSRYGHWIGNDKYGAGFYGTFYNCILNSGSYYMTYPDNSEAVTVLINCLYSKEKDYVDAGCSLQNCYAYTSTDKYIFSLTKEELQNNNYLGNDGTVVGIYGGNNPYTLSPGNKKVTSKFHLDKDSKQIQFSIKVSDPQ